MAFTLPRPLSHSSISMYQECPQKYKFKYIDKVPEKPRYFFSFGQTVHTALEFFYGAKEPPAPALDELLAHYKEKWISAGYKDELQEHEYFEEGKRILVSFHKKHAKTYHVPYFVEYAFNLEVDGVPVTGKVDRIDRLPDGRIEILDYKTGKTIPGKRVSADAQLTMYQLACETLLGAEVARMTLYHLPSLKEHESPRHEAALVDGVRRRVVGTAEAIDKGRFDPKPNDAVCRWCDYKPICPVFKDPSAPAAEAAGDADLSAWIDALGEMEAEASAIEEERRALKERILEELKKRNYVRAFGSQFEARRAVKEKWEFADKTKVLDILKKAGLYEKVLAPSAPKVEQLMSDPGLDPSVRARLSELGAKIEVPDLKITPLEG